MMDDSFDPNLDPNLFDSQLTATSVIESELTQSARVDPFLKRVGPDQRK